MYICINIYIYVYRSIYRLIPPFFFISRICMMHVSPTASTKAGGTDLKATQSYPGLSLIRLFRGWIYTIHVYKKASCNSICPSFVGIDIQLLCFQWP